MNIEQVDEWLDDVVDVCCNRHIVSQVRRVQFANGSFVKMCRACYAKEYPEFNYDELTVC